MNSAESGHLPFLFTQLEEQIVYNITVQNFTNVEIIAQMLFSKYSCSDDFGAEARKRSRALYCLALFHIGKYDAMFDLISQPCEFSGYYIYIWYYTYLGNLNFRNKNAQKFKERQSILARLDIASAYLEDNDGLIRELQLYGTPDMSMILQKQAYLFLETILDHAEAIKLLKTSVKLNPLNIESVVKLNELNVSDLDVKANLSERHAIQELTYSREVNDIGNLFYAFYKVLESFTENDYFKCIRILKANLGDFLHANDEQNNIICTNTLLYYIFYKCFIELFEYEEAYVILCKKLLITETSSTLHYNAEPESNNVNLLREVYITASVNLWQSFKITSDFKFVKTLYNTIQTMIENKQTQTLPCLISMAMLYSCLNENEQSLKLLNKAVQKNPNYFYTYNLLANEYINIEEYDMAFKIFSRSLTLNKYFYKTYYSLGLLYLNNGDYEKSLPQLLESLRLNKINLIVLSTIGINLEKLHKTEEAKKYYKLVLTLYKEVKQNIFIQNYINLSHFKLANLAYQEKDYIEALNLLSDYTKANFKGYPYSNGTFCNIYYLLSQIYLKLDDVTSSLNFKNMAISLDPSIYNK